MSKTLFRLENVHIGFSRVEYTVRGDEGILHYALCMMGTSHEPEMHLMRCSRDWEPQGRVWANLNCEFELPKGDSELEVMVRDWIETYNEE